MRIALYIEDGLEQVVLTPESETERGILGKLNDGSRDLAIRHGQFFHCQGGYVHQNHGERSTMIVLTPAKPKEPERQTTFADPCIGKPSYDWGPSGVPADVSRVAEALRDECFKVFGAKWSYDVSWSFAGTAIAAMNGTKPDEMPAPDFPDAFARVGVA